MSCLAPAEPEFLNSSQIVNAGFLQEAALNLLLRPFSSGACRVAVCRSLAWVMGRIMHTCVLAKVCSPPASAVRLTRGRAHVDNAPALANKQQ